MNSETLPIHRSLYGNYAGFRITIEKSGLDYAACGEPGEGMTITTFRLAGFKTYFAAVKAAKAEIIRFWEGRL